MGCRFILTKYPFYSSEVSELVSRRVPSDVFSITYNILGRFVGCGSSCELFSAVIPIAPLRFCRPNEGVFFSHSRSVFITSEERKLSQWGLWSYIVQAIASWRCFTRTAVSKIALPLFIYNHRLHPTGREPIQCKNTSQCLFVCPPDCVRFRFICGFIADPTDGILTTSFTSACSRKQVYEA